MKFDYLVSINTNHNIPLLENKIIFPEDKETFLKDCKNVKEAMYVFEHYIAYGGVKTRKRTGETRNIISFTGNLYRSLLKYKPYSEHSTNFIGMVEASSGLIKYINWCLFKGEKGLDDGVALEINDKIDDEMAKRGLTWADASLIIVDYSELIKKYPDWKRDNSFRAEHYSDRDMEVCVYGNNIVIKYDKFFSRQETEFIKGFLTYLNKERGIRPNKNKDGYYCVDYDYNKWKNDKKNGAGFLRFTDGDVEQYVIDEINKYERIYFRKEGNGHSIIKKGYVIPDEEGNIVSEYNAYRDNVIPLILKCIIEYEKTERGTWFGVKF